MSGNDFVFVPVPAAWAANLGSAAAVGSNGAAGNNTPAAGWGQAAASSAWPPVPPAATGVAPWGKGGKGHGKGGGKPIWAAPATAVVEQRVKAPSYHELQQVCPTQVECGALGCETPVWGAAPGLQGNPPLAPSHQKGVRSDNFQAHPGLNSVARECGLNMDARGDLASGVGVSPESVLRSDAVGVPVLRCDAVSESVLPEGADASAIADASQDAGTPGVLWGCWVAQEAFGGFGGPVASADATDATGPLVVENGEGALQWEAGDTQSSLPSPSQTVLRTEGELRGLKEQVQQLQECNQKLADEVLRGRQVAKAIEMDYNDEKAAHGDLVAAVAKHASPKNGILQTPPSTGSPTPWFGDLTPPFSEENSHEASLAKEEEMSPMQHFSTSVEGISSSDSQSKADFSGENSENSVNSPVKTLNGNGQKLKKLKKKGKKAPKPLVGIFDEEKAQLVEEKKIPKNFGPSSIKKNPPADGGDVEGSCTKDFKKKNPLGLRKPPEAKKW